MATVVQEHLASERKCSLQLGLRCPMCVNEKCGETKAFFRGAAGP